jgi:hypothetical protein
MVENLVKNPTQLIKITDDSDAKALLFELGLSGRFSLNPPNVPRGKPSSQVIRYTEHATHFILAVLHRGHPSDDLNGYEVVCFPKSQYSLSAFNEVADQSLKPLSGDVVGGQGFSGHSPDN